jgi:hypothetical protein
VAKKVARESAAVSITASLPFVPQYEGPGH